MATGAASVGNSPMPLAPRGFRGDSVSTVSRVKAGVVLDRLDVGGGFPSIYSDVAPAPLSAFVRAIGDCVDRLPVGEHCRLMCEPGRAQLVTHRPTARQVSNAGRLDPEAFWPFADVIGGSRWPGHRGGPRPS